METCDEVQEISDADRLIDAEWKKLMDEIKAYLCSECGDFSPLKARQFCMDKLKE